MVVAGRHWIHHRVQMLPTASPAASALPNRPATLCRMTLAMAVVLVPTRRHRSKMSSRRNWQIRETMRTAPSHKLVSLRAARIASAVENPRKAGAVRKANLQQGCEEKLQQKMAYQRSQNFSTQLRRTGIPTSLVTCVRRHFCIVAISTDTSRRRYAAKIIQDRPSESPTELQLRFDLPAEMASPYPRPINTAVTCATSHSFTKDTLTDTS